MATGLHMKPLATQPQIMLSDLMIKGGPINPDVDFKASAGTVRDAMIELGTIALG
ncbi:hypothetical protein ABENE_12380 [Asticcacaulis benevestitus DSM 16100 = ATCC BAA-896]|uniref:Uncharacterized protein n=1 Tax=Asticcacaulis benevestitus DSM 16100 = ATCC BAA-896 TaxID=1121022 RepID=V4P9B3_9CAUL|nr:hypothetical protein ABENE_12380 [Asticcacaulis benevestitus DSM 16100 = ATCC BAA-896]